MARVNNLSNFLTDVASAIKTKKGSETAIPAADFDTEILALPSQGVYQTKVITINENGQSIITPDTGYDAMDGVQVTTNVPEKQLQNKTYSFTTNQTIELLPDTGYDGFDSVVLTINVPSQQINNQDKTITQNGTYQADSGYTGIGIATVNIPDHVRLFSSYADLLTWENPENNDMGLVGEYISSNVIAGIHYCYGLTIPTNITVLAKASSSHISNWMNIYLDNNEQKYLRVSVSTTECSISSYGMSPSIDLYFTSSDGEHYTRQGENVNISVSTYEIHAIGTMSDDVYYTPAASFVFANTFAAKDIYVYNDGWNNTLHLFSRYAGVFSSLTELQSYTEANDKDLALIYSTILTPIETITANDFIVLPKTVTLSNVVTSADLRSTFSKPSDTTRAIAWLRGMTSSTDETTGVTTYKLTIRVTTSAIADIIYTSTDAQTFVLQGSDTDLLIPGDWSQATWSSSYSNEYAKYFINDKREAVTGVYQYINNVWTEILVENAEYNTNLALTNQILGSELLPYIELEYIRSTGTQYIDTNIPATDTVGMYAQLSSSNISSDLVYFGSRGSGDTRCWCGNNGKRVYFGWNTVSTRQDMIVTDAIYEITLNYQNDRKAIFSGDIIRNIDSTQLGENNYSIYVFAGNNAGNMAYNSEIKLYKFKISVGTEIVCDLIPVKRRSDDEICMYDKVTNQFFTNQGTGVFIAGPIK